MPLVKVKTKGQITLPCRIRERLGLSEGDMIEIDIKDGHGVIIPQRVVPATPAPKLSAKEQRVVAVVRRKVTAIQQDLKSSKGLTPEEADVAAKVGLIDPEQKWWWLESWQEGEREAERDIQAGRVTAYDTPEAFLESLAAR
ncbi:MAG: AbrB/MazE/SpoVT family DNA-binding domain-containing protein [Candidatus Latescibacterota bacterium]|jgi:AbrB family looped-hinge helix DNA binding protein